MPAPTNALAATLKLDRTVTGRASKVLEVIRTMTDFTEFQYIEQKLTGNSVANVINFGPITTADFVLIYTPQKIGAHISNVAAQEIQVGSTLLLLDTNVTSIALDNDLLATPLDVTVEIWLGALTT